MKPDKGLPLRGALGDAPRAARYIRTVPRYGYAFHGDARPAPVVDVPKPTLTGARLVSKRRDWLLSDGPNLVGRDRECAVRIDSTSISRRHARIVVTSGETMVEDLGSKNGTYVNGELARQPVALKDGDQIRVGSATITYRILASLPSTVTRRA